mgnify:CR=1 FL=1
MSLLIRVLSVVRHEAVRIQWVQAPPGQLSVQPGSDRLQELSVEERLDLVRVGPADLGGDQENEADALEVRARPRRGR